MGSLGFTCHALTCDSDLYTNRDLRSTVSSYKEPKLSKLGSEEHPRGLDTGPLTPLISPRKMKRLCLTSHNKDCNKKRHIQEEHLDILRCTWKTEHIIPPTKKQPHPCQVQQRVPLLPFSCLCSLLLFLGGPQQCSHSIDDLPEPKHVQDKQDRWEGTTCETRSSTFKNLS